MLKIMKSIIILPLLIGGFNTQPNNANNVNYNLSSTITEIDSTENEIETGTYTEDYLYQTTLTNALLNINGYINTQEQRLFNDDELVIKTNNNSTHYTTTYYWLEIESTRYLPTANLTLQLYMNINTRDVQNNIRLNYTYFTSQAVSLQTYWQGVEDQVADPEFNYTQIQNLTNGNWTQKYTSGNGTIQNVNQQTMQTLTITTDILAGTNYLAIYIEPYIRVNTYTPNYYLYDTIANGTPWADIVHYSNTITLSGTYDNTQYNYEVVDIPGMMFEILTMPFTFISMAFNLTLFPGTPYTLDVSNLFLTIIGILIIVWILKKLVFKS